MSNNYPAGAEHDSSAPYNQKDYGKCTYCGGSGHIQDKEFCKEEKILGNCDGKGCLDCMIECTKCDGTGERIEQDDIDDYESWLEDTKEN